MLAKVALEENDPEARVPRVSRALTAWGRPWEVVLVDDGSSDGSRALLRAAHTRDSRFRIVLLKRNAAGLTRRENFKDDNTATPVAAVTA